MLSFKKFVLFTLVLPFSFLSLSVSVLSADEAPPYNIGPEDVLDINVWQSPDLTKSVTVDSRGDISYSFLGTISVLGKSPSALEKILKDKLAQGYVKDPKVSVSIKEYNSKKILVFGDVVQPGMYKLKGDLPLLEMLFMVGGVKPDAKRMTVIRPEKKSELPAQPQEGLSESALENPNIGELDGAKAIEVNLINLLSKGDLSQNIFIHPGDTIYVSTGTGERFYVLGQVMKPGPYEWIQDITVLEAIKLAEGGTEKAALNRILVRRHNTRGEEEETIKLNVVDIMKGKKKDDVMVKAGDVIVVPESWI